MLSTGSRNVILELYSALTVSRQRRICTSLHSAIGPATYTRNFPFGVILPPD